VKRLLLILAGLALCCFAVMGLKDILTSTSAQTPSSELIVAQFPIDNNTSGTIVQGASKDGRRVVFSSTNNYNGGNGDGNFEVWVHDLDSRSIIQITNTQDNADPFVNVDNRTPSISGDGTKIVFHSNGVLGDMPNQNFNYEIYLADLPRGATTATVTRLTNTGPNFGNEFMRGKVGNYQARVNDDGSAIVFVSNRITFNPTNVAGPVGGTFTAVNPDFNDEIVYLRFDPTQMRYQYTQVTISVWQRLGPGGFNAQPIISGDGMVVAFYSDFNYQGRNEDADGDFPNEEIFLSRYDPGSNGFNTIQVTDTVVDNMLGAIIPACDITGACGVTPSAAMNVFFSFTNPLSSDGRWLVLESAGNYDGTNNSRTRNLWLYDTVAQSFRRLTNQTASPIPTQDELRRIDYNYMPSINSAGTLISFNSTLNLVPTSPSDVNTDNGDGSSDIFQFDTASGSFRQLTFTPPSPVFLDQRQNKTSTFISDPSLMGDTTVSFNYNAQSFLPTNATNVVDLFQVMIRPVTRVAGGATIVNSASIVPTQVGRGSLSTIFGNELANSPLVASSPYPYILNGVSVKVSRIAAQITFISPTQINFIMPQGIANGIGLPFTINNNGVQSNGTINVVDSSPGIFTLSANGAGAPQARCLSKLQDGTDMYYDPPCIVSNGNITTVLFAFGTGWRNSTAGLQVKINDRTLDAVYNGREGGGDRDQFNLVIPTDLAPVTDADLSVVTRDTSIESNRTKISFLGAPTSLTVNDNGAGGAAADCLIKTPGMPDVYTSPPCQVSNGTTMGILVIYGSGWRSVSNTQVRIDDEIFTPIYSGPRGSGELDQINLILPSTLAGRTGLLSVRVPAASMESNRVGISFQPLP
jgi:uncharacterized protein (TIGR03437 family)